MLVVNTVPALSLDVPEYRFNGASNDELYDTLNAVTAETGTQIILPDETTPEVLPYGVVPLNAYSVGAGGVTPQGGYTLGADGYPDIWGGSANYYDSGNAYTPALPLPDVTLDALRQSDGSLGTLSIPTLNVTAKLFENDMSMGVGHIPGSALWNGNIAIMGHNRGTNKYFADLGNLIAGNTITLATNQGTRTYAVTYIGVISATDWSKLQPTSENTITLISCIISRPEVRQCVQAVEII